MCAFLGIDTGRMKIVGIREGSTIIETDIQTEEGLTQQESIDQLAQIEEDLNEGIENNEIDVGGAFLSHSTRRVVYNDDGSVYAESEEE